MIEQRKPTRILFLGDNDTALNRQFASAAVRLAPSLRGIDVSLPRIGLDQPKGIDDCREAMGAKFDRFLEGIIETAIPLPPDMDVDALAFVLFKQ